MKTSFTLLLAVAMVAAPAHAKPAAQPRELGVEAGISFPSNSTIRDYEADGDEGVWIQDSRRNWYYARLFGPCPSLGFARAIGVETRGTSRLDKNAVLLVRDDSCALSSFVTSAPPPTKAERKAAIEAAKAAKATERAAEAN